MPPSRLGHHATAAHSSHLERAAILHVGIFAIAATWAFGGQADWVRLPLAWWGSLGVVITCAALGDPEIRRQGPLRWLWPLGAFNLLVGAACFNPSLREIVFDGEILLAHAGARPGLPSTARPLLSLEALWIFDTIWLSCFNLALVVQRRRALRRLLLALVINAVALAIFGTVQHLSHAKGLFFDSVPTRQPRFFASFVYHNHWGAFAVMMMAACIAITWHHARRDHSRDIWHGPILGGWVALLLLAATIPLSGSRSCTLLALALLGVAATHLAWRVVRRRRHYRESIVPPVAGIALALLLMAGTAWFVGRDTILSRLQATREQVAEIREMGSLGERASLYRDTWRMAGDKPWFGWGMGSYPFIFSRLYNTRSSPDNLPVFYYDAHSDWLQAFAEHGIIGSVLLALCVLLPLWKTRPGADAGPFVGYLLCGCLLIVLYAWVEFPFGNFAVVLTWWTLFFAALQSRRLRLREAATHHA